VIAIVRLTGNNALVFKEIRLRALQDSPSAFSSTYERESGLTDAEWIARVEQWNGTQAAGFLAMDGEIACGTAGAVLDAGHWGRATLVGMWVAPDRRRCGIGRSLVDTVMDWARRRSARVIELMVTCNNEAAIGLYRRLGFQFTGRTLRHAHQPGLYDCEMARPIA
jgi:ribosomal protein S18 acetylase RimI-like enzyme